MAQAEWQEWERLVRTLCRENAADAEIIAKYGKDAVGERTKQTLQGWQNGSRWDAMDLRQKFETYKIIRHYFPRKDAVS